MRALKNVAIKIGGSANQPPNDTYNKTVSTKWKRRWVEPFSSFHLIGVAHIH